MLINQPWYKTLSRYQWLILTVAWLGWVFDIMDTALFNFAKTGMLKELLPTSKDTAVVDGAFLTLLLIGWSVGGLLFGILADKWGRVKTLTVTVLIYCIFTGATALCHSWQEVAVIRFITALGIGGEWAAGAALLAEAFPDKARAPGAALLQSAAAFGPLLAACINLAVPAQSWRLLFLMGILPAFITILIRLKVREPAAWRERGSAREPWLQPLRLLFAEPIWRRHAVIALVIGVCGIAAAGNVSYWLPNRNKELGAALTDQMVKQNLSYLTMILHIGTLIGVFIVPWLCERLGRKRTLAIFFCMSPVSVALAYGLADTLNKLMLLAPIMSLFSIGMSAGFVLYFPELFPTKIRATGIGFAYNVGRILAAGVPILTGVIATTAHSIGMAVAATAMLPLLALVAIAFAPETKGKPLPA